MPKKKSKFHDRPHVMDPDVKRRFTEIITGKKIPAPKKKPRWQLWRWDTLEDAPPELNPD